ncbi:MAG: LURP-one-related family protein [Oscillospiraceae bacterium]|nr:LURP-one-related family protein [Oscillospiraceae bacterium]
MKLYIKQKAFSWRDRFTVKDEYGNDRWFAQGELFSWGRKLHVYDVYGREAAFVRRKLMVWLPRYVIEMEGFSCTLVKEFSFFRPKFYLEGVPWRMEGDFWAHEFSLADERREVMRVSKHWFTWGDSYELDIPDPNDELLCLCIVLALDGMRADAAAAAAAT